MKCFSCDNEFTGSKAAYFGKIGAGVVAGFFKAKKAYNDPKSIFAPPKYGYPKPRKPFPKGELKECALCGKYAKNPLFIRT